MKWEKPAASDMRFGFEITMYIANRGSRPARRGNPAGCSGLRFLFSVSTNSDQTLRGTRPAYCFSL
jgi:coenzyme PQQ precursor peptide PqqA